jgi:hypothetical protein
MGDRRRQSASHHSTLCRVPAVGWCDVGCLLAGVLLILCVVPVDAAIDTTELEQPWPTQRMRVTEVGTHAVHWRQWDGKDRGLFGSMEFVVPYPLDVVWEQSTNLDDIVAVSPDIQSMRIVETAGHRTVVEAKVRVLWRVVTMVFEIEETPQEVVRFRLYHSETGEYVGMTRFTPVTAEQAPATDGEHTGMVVSTRFRFARQVPGAVVLPLQRMILLRGMKRFMEGCQEKLSRR